MDTERSEDPNLKDGNRNAIVSFAVNFMLKNGMILMKRQPNFCTLQKPDHFASLRIAREASEWPIIADQDNSLRRKDRGSLEPSCSDNQSSISTKMKRKRKRSRKVKTGFCTMIVPAEDAELFDVSPMPPTTPFHAMPTCTTFVPTMLLGHLVVQKISELGHTGFGIWETTNTYFNNDTDGFNYRLSPVLAHTHPKIQGHHALIPWGTRFQATLMEGRSGDTNWKEILGNEPIPEGHATFDPRLTQQMGSPKIPIENRYTDKGSINPWISKAQSEMQIARRQNDQLLSFEQAARPAIE